MKSGEMTKNNGIVWIIHNLWQIKVAIFPSMLPNFVDKEAKRYIFRYANLDFQNMQLKARIFVMKSWIKDQLIMKNGSKIQSLLRNYSQPNLVDKSELMKFNTDIGGGRVPFGMNLSLPKNLKSLKRSQVRRISMFSTTNLLQASVPTNFFDSVKGPKLVEEPEKEEYKYPNESLIKKSRPTSVAGILYQSILKDKNRKIGEINKGQSYGFIRDLSENNNKGFLGFINDSKKARYTTIQCMRYIYNSYSKQSCFYEQKQRKNPFKRLPVSKTEIGRKRPLLFNQNEDKTSMNNYKMAKTFAGNKERDNSGSESSLISHETSFGEDPYLGYIPDPTKFCYPDRIVQNNEITESEVITIIKGDKDIKKLQADQDSGVCPPTYCKDEDSFLNSKHPNINEAQEKLKELLKSQTSLEKKICTLKSTELKRVAKEYCCNYIFQSRYGARIKDIIKVLFGEEKYEVEFNKYLKSSHNLT
ncbi:unnamed protein product [Moneuplotes crassus]|uniref:Uncharacterized protein n=1 Tax=Euplotes crassus TaxID=5936 RepID=A0AAD2D7B6_EUPCR|nr:unnamed protein product [Moneuplotes crassus]